MSDAPAEPHARLDDLLATLDEIKIARPAAVQVIACVDDPNANAQKVAHTIEVDPAMTAQIMKLANSAFYGVSGRVGNTAFAVTVIGFSAVRSLAAVNATGLDRPGVPVPEGFWRHAASAAAGSSAVAGIVGIPVGDAFAAGLLHDLGLALLHGFDQATHRELIAQYGGDGFALRCAEEVTFGMGHDAVAARVLEAWRFPEAFVTGVACHHVLPAEPSDFVRVVAAGDAIAALIEETHVEGEDPVFVLERMGIPAGVVPDLVETAAARATEIMASLPGGS